MCSLHDLDLINASKVKNIFEEYIIVHAFPSIWRMQILKLVVL